MCLSHSVVSNSLQPTNCSLPGFSVQGVLQTRTFEWVAIPFSRVSSQQGLNPGLLHCRQIPHHLSHRGSPNVSIIHDYLTRLIGILKSSLVWKWFQQLREWSKSQVLIKTLSGHSPGREGWKSWEVVCIRKIPDSCGIIA